MAAALLTARAAAGRRCAGRRALRMPLALALILACAPLALARDVPHPAGRVHDRFWLKGIGGSTPSAALAEGLSIALGKLRAH